MDTATEQFIGCFDAADGRELWRQPRKDLGTWCTPLVAKTDAGTQIIANGWKDIGAYDFNTGERIWWLAEGGDNPVSSPVRAGDLAILTSGHGKYRPMRAVRLDSKGDIQPPDISETNHAVVWCHPRKGNYLQTPIVVGDLLWGCTNDGIVTCFNVRTRQIYYEERLGNGRQGFTASPVAANGHIYFTGEMGDVYVLAATNKFQVAATNQLGGICLATPAIAGDSLLFQTTEDLLAFSGSTSSVKISAPVARIPDTPASSSPE